MAKKSETSSAPEKKSPFKVVIQNLAFHNFEEESKLIALYKDTVTLGDEENIDPKTGKPVTFIANVMYNVETGEECYVQNSYSIEKAIKKAKSEYKELISEVVFEIEFLGKTQVKGKPFNQFKIGYCTFADYEQSNG